MRVIAGKARRLPLKTVPGTDTRPTTDRIKETLFNMLQNELYGVSFLDLFSGSGAIGIEALSRGAGKAVFVENNKKAAACILENLKFTKLAALGEILTADALQALRMLEGKQVFQMVFMDPPYGKGLEKEVLSYLADSVMITEETLLIVEASLDTGFDYLEEIGYTVVKRKAYKTNVHMFLHRTKGESI